MDHDDLLSGAEYLLQRHPRKPRQADLKRATSSIYYALFHLLARTCADAMIGTQGADRSKPAWRQVYRSLEHGFAKKQCENNQIISRFPNAVQDFANAFVTMQKKRHAADYDPHHTVSKSEVVIDHASVTL